MRKMKSEGKEEGKREKRRKGKKEKGKREKEGRPIPGWLWGVGSSRKGYV